MTSTYPGRTIPDLKAEGLSYRPQLDSLRAIAVFLVMLHHFPLPLPFLNEWRDKIHLGGLGVDLFFVLSGFLITSILIHCRSYSESSRRDKYYEIRMFYIRRFLRIFPIFYLTLFATALINVGDARGTFFWNFFYLTNFYMSLKGIFISGFTHLWSLAVEEQFYLIWPWVIFFTPRKYLLHMILVFIACGPCFRAICVLADLNFQTYLYMPFSSWDALGLGALLAFFCQRNEATDVNQRTKFIKAGLYIGLPFCLINHILSSLHIFFPILTVLHKTMMDSFFVWVIFKASQGFKGVMGKVLEYRPLVYLGKISYGMYLFHYFMPNLVPRAFRLLNLPYPASKSVVFLIFLFATLLSAVLSWHFIEKPLVSLKNRFKYKVVPGQKDSHSKVVT